MLEMAIRENSPWIKLWHIEHYRKLLANETDETRRQMIVRLLAEEEAKLSGLENFSKKRKTAR